jgi:hypothetical protein
MRRVYLKPGVVVHTCNPSTWEEEEVGDGEFKISLGVGVEAQVVEYLAGCKAPEFKPQCCQN